MIVFHRQISITLIIEGKKDRQPIKQETLLSSYCDQSLEMLAPSDSGGSRVGLGGL